MPAEHRKGCCCGPIFFLFTLLSVMAVLAVSLYLYRSGKLFQSIVSPAPRYLSRAGISPGIYSQARRKVDKFLAGGSELVLSSLEINALVYYTPQTRWLGRAAVINLKADSAEITCSIPVNLPFTGNRYINYSFEIRPTRRGDKLELEILGAEHDGKPLTRKELQTIQQNIIPLIAGSFNAWNGLQFGKGANDVRIVNGTLTIQRG
ncbi:MAG: hypothetical protein JOY96_08685 [Verrucomicrobia bacterium]|nr:hypothetical protein [Verrucomicrobiota bacterium]